MGEKAIHALYLRIISAFLLMPVVLGAIIMGGVLFGAMLGLAFILGVREWLGMARHGAFSWPVIGAGIVYILLGFASFLYLRDRFPDGAGLCLGLILSIWASDSAAYFAGKSIGGPKMAPAISPNKTWAGLFGGVVGSAAGFILYVKIIAPWFASIGPIDLAILEGTDFVSLLLIGASITLTGQAGDLLESFAKRRAGVKDSGALIPGHGGLLDRIDSLLLAAPLFLLTIMVVA
jgi:phosphatidate cytidylyltransferase